MYNGNPSLVTPDYRRFTKFANANTLVWIILIWDRVIQ